MGNVMNILSVIGFIYNMDFNRMKKWLHEKEK